MPIDIELLVKAAKVYEAAEPVDGMQPKEVYESHKKCAPGEFGMNKEGAEYVTPDITKDKDENDEEKRSGWYSEVIGSNINPLNIIGNPAAALAAYLTPTRSIKEQAQADKSTWSNILIPGKGAYNRWKRLGTTMRGPEINAARQELKNEKKKPTVTPDKKEDVPATPATKAAAFIFGKNVAKQCVY